MATADLATVDEEVAAAARLHQAAQARLGFAAAYLALAEWQAVSAINGTGAVEWIANSLKVILAIRKMSRRLAVTHYQLVRALEIGRTLGAPEGSPATTKETTLGGLRSNFRNAAIDAAALPAPRTRSDDPDIRWFEEKLASVPPDKVPGAVRLDDIEVDPLIQIYLDKEGHNDSVNVTVDRYDWPQDLTLEEVDDAFRALLRKQAVDDTAAKVKNLRSSPDITPDEAITGIEDAHSVGGSVGSGTVDYAGMDAGRDAVRGAIKSDRLVLAVARGTGPDPCAFCAMLASRGFVFKSEATAGVGDDETIKKYHVHCHCFPIYKFVKLSALPPLSQYFKEQWPIVTAGRGGNDARKAWRRWIYAQRKANPDAPHGALSQLP
jgi:hypothetical protein